MNTDGLRTSIERMGMCLLIAGSPASALQDSDSTARLIDDIQRELRAGESRATVDSHLETAKRRVKEAIRSLKAIAGDDECDEPATVFLGAFDPKSSGELVSSVEIHIIGGSGDAYLSFLSGTNLSAVVAAVNALKMQTGVQAFVSVENPNRIRLESVLSGSDQFITVRQLNGKQPILFPQAEGWAGLFEWTDYGCAFGAPVCADPAEVYLSANPALDLQDNSLLTLEIMGSLGAQQFTFYSGTSQPNIIAAINTFTNETGVTASQNDENTDRIEFNSTLLGSSGWVRVKQINFPKYPYNLLAETPTQVVSTSDLTDYGKDGLPGDANCDFIVDLGDLSFVLAKWGTCPQPPDACPADLTGNGIVDVDDLLRVLNHWTK